MDILKKLQIIFRDIFDDETIILKRETSNSDIEDWDSFAQINIITACEHEFSIKFDLDDISLIKNVGSIINLIERKKI